MNQALRDMLEAYQPKTPADYQNAVREVVQEITLLGLWRGGFFEHAAFYGGTALRIFHGLRRFSEDLDFTLLGQGDNTRLDSHLAGVATELAAWGFAFDAEPRSEGDRTGIESAFLKGNTQVNLLHIGAPPELARRLPCTRKIQIKLEMDLQPPPFATTEVRTQLLPSPYQVTLYDLASLFAGKLHAVLCRGWKHRVKGRDFHDFVWYVGRKVRPNLAHLDARMRQSGHWTGEDISMDTVRRLLRERIEGIDFRKAADEVRVFLHDPRELELWSKEFFLEVTERIETG
jgi:hypothetical protein